MISCNRVQEEIAWGRDLAPEHQAHALDCAVCSRTLLEFARLDALYAGADEVPEDFADRVMNSLPKRESHSISRPALTWTDRLRLVFAYGSLVMGLASLLGTEVR